MRVELRSIVEEILLDVQFELPSRPDVQTCLVTRETVDAGRQPTLVTTSSGSGEGDEDQKLA